MIAARIQVDPTLPPAQFNEALKREAHRVREERRLMRMWDEIRARRIEKAAKQFREMGWLPDAALELAEIHVTGVPV